MNKFHALLLVFLGFVSLILVGCGGGGGDSGGGTVSGGGGGTSNSTSSNYSISGTVNDAYNGNPHLSGVTVTLTSESSPTTRYSTSTTTSGEGFYDIQEVPPGNYVIRFAYNGYVATNTHFPISSNLAVNQILIKIDDWNRKMGDTNHPYDSNTGYLAVGIYNPIANSQGVNEGISGAKISCSPANYGALGYKDWGFIDWKATQTNNWGGAFIYKVPVGQTYTLSVTNADTTYPDMYATVNAGEQSDYNFYNYRPKLQAEIDTLKSRFDFLVYTTYNCMLKAK